MKTTKKDIENELAQLKEACRQLVAAHERRHKNATFWTLNETQALSTITSLLRK